MPEYVLALRHSVESEKSVRHFKLLCKTTIYRTQIPLIAQIFFKQQHDLWNLRDLCDQFQVSAYGLRLSLQNQMSNNICGGPSPMPPNRGFKGGWAKLANQHGRSLIDLSRAWRNVKMPSHLHKFGYLIDIQRCMVWRSVWRGVKMWRLNPRDFTISWT